jgi:hypothetical protein
MPVNGILSYESQCSIFTRVKAVFIYLTGFVLLERILFRYRTEELETTARASTFNVEEAALNAP